MTTPTFNGRVRFKIAGQEALSKWAQEAIRNALESADAPPESLRFQCRIATDARENFKTIELDGGETLTLSPKGNPQFGKNRDGHPYLTVTLVYSGDGLSYRFRWLGDAVPSKMQQVAVKHDKGQSVRATTVGLDLARAEVTPSWKVNGKTSPPTARDWAQERQRKGSSGIKRSPRRCGRITDADVSV